MRAGKNLITNAIKSLPSFLKVNHTDSDVDHSKCSARADLTVCQIAVHLAFLQLEEFPIQLIQLNYESLQA